MSPESVVMTKGIQYCDNCGVRLVEPHDIFPTTNLSFPIASANTGESATLCEFCYGQQQASDTPTDDHPPHRNPFTMTFSNNVTVSVWWELLIHPDDNKIACMAWDKRTGKGVKVLGFYCSDDIVLYRLEPDDIARFLYSASIMTIGVNG